MGGETDLSVRRMVSLLERPGRDCFKEFQRCRCLNIVMDIKQQSREDLDSDRQNPKFPSIP